MSYHPNWGLNYWNNPIGSYTIFLGKNISRYSFIIRLHTLSYNVQVYEKCTLMKHIEMKKVTVLSKWPLVMVYSKAAVYKCKLMVYTCKVLNSRFTTVLLRTLLHTVEVTPFFQIFFCVKQWFTCVYRCKPPLYKL